jgi:hypothetical protein
VKTIKLMAVMILALVLLALTVGLVAAAPLTVNHFTHQAGATQQLAEGAFDMTGTTDLSGIVAMTHPVGLALSLFFTVPYSEVIALHQEGLGYGEIARAFFIAQNSEGTLTAQAVIDMFQSGQGWGRIMKQVGFKPGGQNLGSIMSGRADQASNSKTPGGKPDCPGNSCNASGGKPDCPGNSCNAPGGKPDCPGNSCNAPGQNKSNKPKK